MFTYYYVFILILCITVPGCATYRISDVYPDLYSDPDTKEGMPIKAGSISKEFLQSLPTDFQIAHYTGHLWCYVDWDGQAKVLPLNRPTVYYRASSAFYDATNQARKDTKRLVFEPVGYPLVACVRPAEAIEDLFDEEWFGQWLLYFSAWDDAEMENERLYQGNLKILLKIADMQHETEELERQAAELDSKIKSTQYAVEITELQIASAKDALSHINYIDIIFPSPKPLPPFNPTIKYDIKRDMFIDIVEKYALDCSDRKWATNQMSGGKYLDPELAAALQKAYEAFENPAAVSDLGVRKEINELLAAGFNGIKANSGGRTPWRQAVLYYESKKNGNPVAKYVGSEHMFAQATDIDVNSFPWGSNDHNKLRKVLSYFGLIFKVKNDPVHVTLAKPSSQYYARRLAMMRAYARRAQDIKSGQVTMRANQIAIFNDISVQAKSLSETLTTRLNQVTEKTGLFARISAQYLAKQGELQIANEDIARARRRAAAAANADRDHHRPGEFQGNRGDGQETPANPPTHEQPVHEPANRPDPPEIRGGGHFDPNT